MERLTKRTKGMVCHVECTGTCETCSGSCCLIQPMVDRLAYYEDMEEQGRLVVLPCKVGDTVYRIFAPDGREPVISAHTLMSVDYIVRWLDEFGKTVFLTREEAENALVTDKNDGHKNGGAEQ